ncbi:MAG: hypothetical protein ACE5NC_07325 [Anaerolineae bacterium]
MISLISPPLLLIVVLASLNAGIFHFLWGRTLKQLGVLWVAAVAGFVVGHLVAAAMGFVLLKLGAVYAAGGVVGAWIAMIIARFIRV